MLLGHATDYGAVTIRKARDAEKGLYRLTGPNSALQLGVAAEPVEMPGWTAAVSK